MNFENCKGSNNFNHFELISKFRSMYQLFFRVVNFRKETMNKTIVGEIIPRRL